MVAEERTGERERREERGGKEGVVKEQRIICFGSFLCQ